MFYDTHNVAKCLDCPLESDFDGYHPRCDHAGRRLEDSNGQPVEDALDVPNEIPSWCPLRSQPLMLKLNLS